VWVTISLVVVSNLTVAAGAVEEVEIPRSCGISKRGGKVPLLDFSSERLLPPTASTTISAKPFDTKLSRYLSQTR
jgi:hypothetical protein